MKILKTILAWLDWSTYGRSGYGFPKSLCAFFCFICDSSPLTGLINLWTFLWQ